MLRLKDINGPMIYGVCLFMASITVSALIKKLNIKLINQKVNLITNKFNNKVFSTKLGQDDNFILSESSVLIELELPIRDKSFLQNLKNDEIINKVISGCLLFTNYCIIVRKRYFIILYITL